VTLLISTRSQVELQNLFKIPKLSFSCSGHVLVLPCRWFCWKIRLITSDASGLGAACAGHWIVNGADPVIGDVNDAAGEVLLSELAKAAL
jgi:hypothetical protein